MSEIIIDNRVTYISDLYGIGFCRTLIEHSDEPYIILANKIMPKGYNIIDEKFFVFHAHHVTIAFRVKNKHGDVKTTSIILKKVENLFVKL